MVTAVCEEESRKDNAGRLPATFYTNGLHGNDRTTSGGRQATSKPADQDELMSSSK